MSPEEMLQHRLEQLNRLVPTVIAPWYTVLLAKMFGKRRQVYCGEFASTQYLYRNQWITTSIERAI